MVGLLAPRAPVSKLLLSPGVVQVHNVLDFISQALRTGVPLQHGLFPLRSFSSLFSLFSF